MFKFGVDTVIWSEDFSENDLWILPRAKEIGFKIWVHGKVVFDHWGKYKYTLDDEATPLSG